MGQTCGEFGRIWPDCGKTLVEFGLIWTSFDAQAMLDPRPTAAGIQSDMLHPEKTLQGGLVCNQPEVPGGGECKMSRRTGFAFSPLGAELAQIHPATQILIVETSCSSTIDQL